MPPETPGPGAPADDARRILVVDDVAEIGAFFDALAPRLARLGIRLETESDPRRAMERVRAGSYALVLSDFRMPGTDGVEVLQQARRAHPRGLRVLMTGYNEVPASIERLRGASVDAYLQKPVSAQELMVLLSDFVSAHPALLDAHRARARDLEQLAARTAHLARVG